MSTEQLALPTKGVERVRRVDRTAAYALGYHPRVKPAAQFMADAFDAVGTCPKAKPCCAELGLCTVCGTDAVEAKFPHLTDTEVFAALIEALGIFKRRQILAEINRRQQLGEAIIADDLTSWVAERHDVGRGEAERAVLEVLAERVLLKGLQRPRSNTMTQKKRLAMPTQGARPALFAPATIPNTLPPPAKGRVDRFRIAAQLPPVEKCPT